MKEIRAKIKKELKVADIIIRNDNKYLICKLSGDLIEMISIDRMLENADFKPTLIPKLEVEYDKLGKYVKIDNSEIFCLLNQDNFLIRKIIEKYLEG